MCPHLCIRMSVCSSVQKDLARPIIWLFLTVKLLTGSGGVSIYLVRLPLTTKEKLLIKKSRVGPDPFMIGYQISGRKTGYCNGKKVKSQYN